MALFGEKYGEIVRTISILESDSALSSVGGLAPDKQSKYSFELCGGTHIDRTSDIGAFLIVSEGSAAAGIRRIEAVTGRGAYELINKRFKTLKQTAGALKSAVEEVPAKVESLISRRNLHLCAHSPLFQLSLFSFPMFKPSKM
jgi:alanyl-tRNA synthetase